MSDDKFTIYYAGDLFDHKHLCGNALLAGGGGAVYPPDRRRHAARRRA